MTPARDPKQRFLENYGGLWGALTGLGDPGAPQESWKPIFAIHLSYNAKHENTWRLVSPSAVNNRKFVERSIACTLAVVPLPETSRQNPYN